MVSQQIVNKSTRLGYQQIMFNFIRNNILFMKKLLLLGLVLALFSCQEEPKIDYAIVSGQIENPTDKTVSLFQGREKITEMTLDQDGKFSDTLKIENG